MLAVRSSQSKIFNNYLICFCLQIVARGSLNLDVQEIRERNGNEMFLIFKHFLNLNV